MAVLDFYNHSKTSNPRLGRELAERISFEIFAQSEGSIEIVDRLYIKTALENMDLGFCETYSKDELICLADSLNVNFIVKGTIIDYQTDVIENIENVLEVLISIIYGKDGSTAAMAKILEHGEDPVILIESASKDAARMMVEKQKQLQALLEPVSPDTANVQ